MARTVEVLLGLAIHKLSAAEGLKQMRFYEDAISRAYYGMYHAAQALLIAYGKRALGHAGTISAFNHHSCKTLGLESKIEATTMAVSGIPLLTIALYPIKKSTNYFMKK